jgi:hypothetical protein
MYKATTGYSKRPKMTFWKTLNYYAKKIICAWYGNISTEQLIKLLKSLHIFVVIGSVRFLVLTLIPLKIQAFLYVMPCQLTDIYGHNDITFMAHNAFITRNKQSKDSVLMASILTVSKWGTTLMSTCYGLKGPGIKCQWGERFSATILTGPRAHTASCTRGTGSISQRQSSLGAALNNHPSSANFKQIIELYLYSPFRTSHSVLEWNLPLPLLR